MVYLLFLTLLIVVVIAPIVIFTVVRVVPRVVDRTVPPIVDRFAMGTSPEVEARLTRIEEAIDAMATEIERIRTGDLESYEAPRRLSARSSRSDAG
ncbi:MAG: hypothetical protein ACT4P6_13880 [Gemmatimonadaceae bacterium]